MAQKKSNKKGMKKIASSSSSKRESKKTRYDDDDASSKCNQISWLLSSQRGKRAEDTPMEGKGETNKRRRTSEEDTSWKRTEVIEKLNDDILEEIMLRLPVKSLIRFQIVSKHWKLAITSSTFKERYRLHQKTQEPKLLCLCLCEDRQNTALKTMRLEWSTTCLVEEEHTSDYKQEEILDSVCDSLDGLVCLYIYKDLTEQIKVINPATRWSYTVPVTNIMPKDSLPGFGKDHVTGTYKLVLLHNTSLSCEVFDFRVKQWRQVIPPPAPHHLIRKRCLPTFANGWLYWLSEDKTNIIAFDLHMETFRVFPNPIIDEASSLPFSRLSQSNVDMRMGSIDDDRCLVWISTSNGDGMQYNWRLTNHNTGGVLLKMDKMFSFDLIKFTSTPCNPYVSLLFKLAAISKNGNKVMLDKRNNNLIMFQPLNSTSRIFTYSPRPNLVPYFPSFVSPL